MRVHAPLKENRKRRRRPAFEALENRQLLSTFNVNNTADDSSVGSLRWAVNQANAAGGSNTIEFDATVFATPQTITLAQGQLELSHSGGNTTISGPAAGLTISAGGSSRVFEVDQGVAATITGLTLTDGSTSGFGGGLYNLGTATLTDCKISGNSAYLGGAMLNFGTATLSGCTLSGNSATYGGGIWNGEKSGSAETVSLSDCTLSGDSAKRLGGGLFSFGIADTTGCTFSGDSAHLDGGGEFNDAGTANVTTCTFTGDTATSLGGAFFNDGGTAVLGATTISGNSAVKNGGGLYTKASSTTTLNDTIVAGNTGGGNTDIDGTVTGSHNLIGSGGSGGLANGSGGNLVGVANPGLAPLGDFGGPTLTMGLLATSPAISAGVSINGITTDQRGLPLDSTATDIGAFQTNPLVVNTTLDGTGSPAGELSLRQAVNLADVLGTSEAITFDPTAFASAQTITLADGQLELSNQIEIDGPAASLSISGGNASRVFQIDASAIVDLADLTIKGGLTSENGGGLAVYNGSLSLSDCTITGNSTGSNPFGRGGGLYNDAGKVSLSGCAISDNTAEGYGGGLYGISGTLDLTDCTISGNSANSGGGLVGKIDLTDCTVSNNIASAGGGVFSFGGSLTDCTIADNSATFGGGVSVVGGTTSLSGCTISGNNATYSGGGVSNQGTADLTSCTIAGNSAVYNGGGLYNVGATTLTDTIVAGNTGGGNSDIDGTVSGSYNLIGTGGSGGLETGASGNKIGVASPGLSPLANHGGPTQTIDLLAGSPAIAGGITVTGITTDQRGLPRSNHGTVDIGAVEDQVSVSLPSSASAQPGVATAISLGSFSDAAGAGPYTVLVQWGDGSTPTSYSLSSAGSLGSETHTFVSQGSYDVTVTVTDANGDVNVAPSAEAVAVAPSSGQTASVMAGGLEFVTLTGYFSASGGVYSTTGGVELGFVPGSGQSFVPLAQLSGNATVDTNALTVACSGTLSAIVSGQTIPLLTAGLGTTSIATLVNQGLAHLSGASVQVAGTSFTLDSIQLNSSGPEIQLQGSIALPIGLTVAVNGMNDVNISASGISLTGVSAALSGSFSVAGATFSASQLQVDYTPSNQEFAITGESSITAGKLGTISLDLGGGSTQGVVITDGVLTGLNATAALNSTLGGGSLTATGLNLVYQPAAGQTPAELALSGAADLKIGTSFDLSLALGTPGSPGLLVQNGSLSSLIATASLSTTLAGAVFTATNVNITYVSASDSFSVSGSAALDLPSGPDLSLTLGTLANPGLVFSNGSLTSLSATANFNATIAAVSFSATALNVTYAPASGITPAQFTVTGDASLTASIGGSSESLNVDFGGGSTAGLVLSGGKVSSLNMTVDSSLVVASVTFDTVGLIITDNVSAAGNVFTMTGSSDFTVGSVGKINVNFGGMGSQGLIITNGSLSSLNMTVTAAITVGGVSFNTTGLVITENVSAHQFTMTGAASFTAGSLVNIQVEFGGPASNGNAASTGLVITNGSLTSLDMTVDANITEAGATLNADGLHFVYNAAAMPATFSLSGTTTASFPGLGSFSATLGTATHPSGLVLQGGSLVSLGVTINSVLTIGGVKFNANNLAFDYTAASGLYTMSGMTGVTVAGIGGLEVTLGTSSQPSGLVVQNGAIASIGFEVDGGFTVGGVTFTASGLEFDYTANPQTFQLLGSASVAVAGVGSFKVTFANQGIVIQNGTLESLDVAVNSNLSVDSVTFTTHQLEFEYTASPQTFQLIGTAGVSVTGIGSFSVTFANQGILISNGTLESLDAVVNSNLSVDGVTFTTKQLTFEYTASPQTFELTGTASASVAGIGGLSVTFGTTEDPAGIKVVNGTLTNLDVSVTGGFSIDGVTISAKNLQFDYMNNPQTFELTGTASVAVAGIGNLSVTFGTAEDPAGIKVVSGVLTNLDVSVTGNFSVDGVTITADNLQFDYMNSPQTFELTGTAGISVAGIGNLSVTFGTKLDPAGIKVVNGTLTNLDVSITGSFSVDAVTFTATNLQFDYIASPQTFEITGTAGVKVAGIGNLSVTFGTHTHPQGILIQNGTLENLDVAITSNFTVDGLTFFTQQLEFDYTANPQTFQILGTAGITIGGISSSSGGNVPGGDSFSVTFGGPLDPEGILIQNGTLESLDATINATFWVDGVEIYAKNLEFAYLASDSNLHGASTFEMAGTVGAALPGGIGNVQVTFGSGGDPGLVIANDALVSLDMTISGSLGVGGIDLAKGNLEFTYTASTHEFTMTGTTSFGLSIAGSMVQFDVDLGGDGTQGLVVINGQLISLDMQVTSSLSVGGVSLGNGDFVMVYTAAHSASGVSIPAEFTMTGDATLGIPNVVSLTCDLGGPGTQGLVIENGEFESLNLTVSAQRDFLGLDASLQLSASYSANTGIFTFGGTAGLSLDTSVLPSWVKTFFNLPSNLSLGQVGFYINVPTLNVSSGYAQFWVVIAGEQVGLEVYFNGATPSITLGSGIAGTIHTISEDASKAYEATAQALSSAYLAAANGIANAYNVTVAALGNYESEVAAAAAAAAKKVAAAVASAAKKILHFFHWGDVAGATVFYDPTGTGVYVTGDPETTTLADGGFNLDLPDGTTGGVIVVMGGTDLSTGQTNPFILTTPLDATELNPFTTLVDDAMLLEPSLTEATATTLVDQALGLPTTFNITQDDYLDNALAGDATSAAIYAEEVKISTVAYLADGLLSGLPSAPSESSIGAGFFNSLAAAIVNSGGTSLVNLSSASEDQSLLISTAAAAGLSVTNDTATAAGQIIATVNQTIDGVPVSGTSAYVGQIAQIQTLTEGTIAAQLSQAGAGTENIDTLAATYNTMYVSTQAAGETIGDLAAPTIDISSVSQAAGVGQPATMDFTVTLTGTPSALQPVTVYYTTADDTATAAGGDYTPVSGTLTWAAGDTTPKTISVPVSAVSPPDAYKYFEVDLSNPTNAILTTPVGTGTILYSEFATSTTLSASALSAAGDAPVTLTAVVTNNDGASSPGVGQVDFYDGTTDLGSASLDSTGTATLTTSFINLGQHTITAVYDGFQVPGGTYDDSTSNSLTETISPAIQTIDFAPIGGQTYGADPIMLDPTSSSSLAVSLSVLSGPATIDDNGVLTLTGAGTVVIEASQAGDSFTAAATPVDQSFYVAPASLTITADDQTSTYGSAYPTLTASYSGFVNGDTTASLTSEPTLTTTAPGSGVGAYAINASGAVDPNYTISYVPGTMTITQADLIVSADDQTSVYGATDPSLTATLVGAGGTDVATLDAEISLTTAPAGSGAGTYEIDASGVTDPNYDVTYSAGTLTITPASLTIQAGSLTTTYGTVPALTPSYCGFVNGDTAASLTLAPTLSTATSVDGIGTYELDAAGAIDPNYTITYVAGSLIVDPAPLTITAVGQTIGYGSPVPTFTASYTGLVDGDTPASLTTAPTLSLSTGATDVGNSTINVSNAFDPNYTINYVAGILTITAAATTTTITPSITAPLVGQDAIYTASVINAWTDLPVTVGSVQFQVDGQNVGAPVALDANGDAMLDPGALPLGSHAITAVLAGSSDFQTSGDTLDEVVSAFGTTTLLSPTQENVSYGTAVTFTTSVTAGAGTPAGSVQFEVDGQPSGSFVSLDAHGTASLTLSALEVGVHTVSAIYGGEGSTFQAGAAVMTIVVIQGNQTISFPAIAPVTYGAGPIKLSASASSGLAVSYSIISGPATLNGSCLTISGAGTITIEADQAGDNDYLGASPVQETIVVAKAKLTVTGANASRVYGAANPSFAGSITGLVNGDNITATYASAAGATTAPGAYGPTSADAIIPTLVDPSSRLSNYTVCIVNGTLTITKDGTTTTVTSSTGSSSFGQALTIASTVKAAAPGSGTPTGAVDFFDTTTGIDLGSVALGGGSTALTTATLPVGTQTITETYSGDGNFVASNSALAQSIVISIYVLNTSTPSPAITGTVYLSGSSSIDIPGQLIVDSPAKPAVTVSGTSQIIASSIGVVGTVSVAGTAKVMPGVNTLGSAVADPLAGLAVPTLTGSAVAISISSGTQTINPGIYSQIKVSGTASLTLSPGIYVITGGGLSVTNSASITGTGVMIYNTGSSYPAAGGTYGGIALTTTGTVNLSAPTTGAYAGILFFQSRTNPTAISITDTATTTLSGIIYTSDSLVSISGSGQITDALVVNRLQLSGSVVANTLPTELADGAVAYAPSQIRAAYGINSVSEDGTGQTIAIVDAYNDPDIAAALDDFDSQFGLTSAGPTLYQQYGPAWSFLTVINQNGQTGPLPMTDPTGAGGDNWELEEALDVEWAHAIAPGARIVLVESDSQTLPDLMTAVATAAAQPDVSVVSMSWGLPEGQAVFAADEAQYDRVFNVPGVTFVASTGDYGAADPEYPAFSPNVVAVGGTSLDIGSDGGYTGETGWGYDSAAAGTFIGSGGGISRYEPEPSYQAGVQSTGYRTTPDVSLVADPATGAWIADPYNLAGASPFEVVGGTSLSAPAWAGLLALVNQERAGTNVAPLNSTNPTETQQALYSLPQADFHGIETGTNGYSAQSGYNLVTGLGTPVASLLIANLAAYQPGTIDSGPKVAPLQNATLAFTGSDTGGSDNVFSVFDSLTIGTTPIGSAGLVFSSKLQVESTKPVVSITHNDAPVASRTPDSPAIGLAPEAAGPTTAQLAHRLLFPDSTASRHRGPSVAKRARAVRQSRSNITTGATRASRISSLIASAPERESLGDRAVDHVFNDDAEIWWSRSVRDDD
jgi:hypothetical protein